MWDPNTRHHLALKTPKEVSEAYQQHILGGIKWALGIEKGARAGQSD